MKKIFHVIILFLFVSHQNHCSKNETLSWHYKSKIPLIDLLYLTPQNIESLELQPISIVNPKIPEEIKQNILDFKEHLKKLYYSSYEKKYYENKNLRDLCATLEVSSNKDEILKSLDHILKKVYSQLDSPAEKVSYLFFKGPLKKKRENSIQQKMELIFINTMVCSSEIYKRIGSNTHLYPVKLIHSILFQKPSSIPNSISYNQITKNDFYEYTEKDLVAERIKALEQIRINTSVSKDWKTFISNLKNDPESITILSKYNSMGILKYWTVTSFKKIWEEHKHNTQKISSALKKEFNESKELFNELFYKHYIVSSTNPISNNNKKLRYQIKVLRKQIVPFFAYVNVSPGKKLKLSSMASYDFKNTFDHLTPLGKLATLNILNETTNTLEKFSNIDNKQIKEESIESMSELHSHLLRLIENPKNKNSNNSKAVVFNSGIEAKAKINDLANKLININNL